MYRTFIFYPGSSLRFFYEMGGDRSHGARGRAARSVFCCGPFATWVRISTFSCACITLDIYLVSGLSC